MCHEQVLSNQNYDCKCRIYFYEERFQDENLNVYYMLDNFFQNSRRYVKSVDNYQLLGLKNNPSDDLGSECEPYRYYKTNNNKKVKIAPCGAIANSLFNGKFGFLAIVLCLRLGLILYFLFQIRLIYSMLKSIQMSP